MRTFADDLQATREAEDIDAAIKAAVLSERETCALIAKSVADHCRIMGEAKNAESIGAKWLASELAARKVETAIRARNAR